MVVDASAIVAILMREPECASLMAALERAEDAATSPIAVYEAALGVQRKRHCSVAEAEADVMDFLSAARVRVAPIERGTAHDGLAAFSRYGKGTRHPAQLNLGDCFAYAQAKSSGAALLFKGDDFARTDVEAAR
ncbi:MAG: type II toxin-antitoxin system VapC family toxin [Hyphomicrobiales bacterium]|nr:type II toxin-antitoxin system VapC family toxin [Hyphomicrobiales bacterium]